MKIKKNDKPWDISFDQRVSNLFDQDKKRVFYIYEKADTSTFRYRAYNMCQALSYSNEWAGSYFFRNELRYLEKYLNNIDVVVFVRTMWSIEMDIFLNKVKKNNIPTLFDVDDLVFDVKKIPLIMNTLNVDIDSPESCDYWFSYVSRVWLLAKKCDSYITTNEYLAKKIEKVFCKKAFVVNNFLNREQLEISKTIINKKNKKKKNVFEIGYFSGTPSHVNDFRIVAPEIKALLDKYKDIKLKVLGFMEFPEYFREYIHEGRLEHKPLVSFLTLQEEISVSNVNIVPLVNNEFTNCKSELKFFEAAIVKTISCATPTYVFKKNIKNGINGFLCNQGEWFCSIESIYKNKINRKLIVENAYDFCSKKYSPEWQVKNIDSILNDVIS